MPQPQLDAFWDMIDGVLVVNLDIGFADAFPFEKEAHVIRHPGNIRQQTMIGGDSGVFQLSNESLKGGRRSRVGLPSAP